MECPLAESADTIICRRHLATIATISERQEYIYINNGDHIPRI